MYSRTMATSQMGGCNFFFFTSGLLPWKKHKSRAEPGRTVAEGGGGCERESRMSQEERKAAESPAITLHCLQLEEISTRLASRQTWPDIAHRHNAAHLGIHT